MINIRFTLGFLLSILGLYYRFTRSFTRRISLFFKDLGAFLPKKAFGVRLPSSDQGISPTYYFLLYLSKLLIYKEFYLVENLVKV